MINMSSLYLHNDYSQALSNFNSSIASKRWKKFKDVQMKVAKDKCPICEYPFSEEDRPTRLTNQNRNIALIPTVDHYRPQDIYPNLAYVHENYLLLCNDCNGVYKDNHFPLYPNTATHTRTATNMALVTHEQPLLANPIYDNPLDLFKLQFRRTTTSNINILELVPKENEQSNIYLYQKAKKTIELFGLKECQPLAVTSENVKQCRINLLNSHYGKIFNLALSINNMDNTDFFNAMIKFKNNKLDDALSYHGFREVYLNLREAPKHYGFYSFLFRKQFIII